MLNAACSPVCDGCTAIQAKVADVFLLEVDLHYVQHHGKLAEQQHPVLLPTHKHAYKFLLHTTYTGK